MGTLPQPIGDEQRNERFSHKTTFHSTSFNSNKSSVPLVEYGYVPDGKRVPDEYLVRVSSIRNSATVVAPLQEDINLRVESHWSPLVPAGLLNAANIGAQALSGGRKSLITKATTRRIWNGSSPMVLSIKMRFEAVLDPVNEVLNPIRILAAIALPAENNTVSNNSAFQAFTNKLPFLGPPGPSPFKLEGVLSKSGEKDSIATALDSLHGGDQIQIELGRFLTFQNVIVKEASPTVPIKFDRNGNPISATINMVFETYEMMTTESFNSSFNSLQSQQG